MSAYDELEFAPMLITDVFDTMKTSSAWFDKNKLQRGAGSYPYVSRSGFSNGFEAAVGHQGVEPNTGNAVTIGVDTQTVFYQPVPFYTSVKIQVLRHEWLNEASGLVLVSLLRSQMQKFAWGNGASLVRLAATRIMVPVMTDSSGDQIVDWEGMTRFGKELELEAKRRQDLVRRTDPDDDTLPDLDFAPMFITEIIDTMRPAQQWFDFVRAKTGGAPEYPYVARSGGTNAISALIPHQGFDPPNPGNAITIGVSTSTIFYQPSAFYTGKEIQVLRHPSMTEDSGLVLVTLIREQMSKFKWGNGASIDRLKATRIMVPATTDDTGAQVVDWEGMTQYGKILRARVECQMSIISN